MRDLLHLRSQPQTYVSAGKWRLSSTRSLSTCFLRGHKILHVYHLIQSRQWFFVRDLMQKADVKPKATMQRYHPRLPLIPSLNESISLCCPWKAASTKMAWRFPSLPCTSLATRTLGVKESSELTFLSTRPVRKTLTEIEWTTTEFHWTATGHVLVDRLLWEQPGGFEKRYWDCWVYEWLAWYFRVMIPRGATEKVYNSLNSVCFCHLGMSLLLSITSRA